MVTTRRFMASAAALCTVLCGMWIEATELPDTGVSGVYEVMVMTENIRQTILRGGSTTDIARLAKSEGMLTLRESAVRKALLGVTTADEVVRVRRRTGTGPRRAAVRSRSRPGRAAGLASRVDSRVGEAGAPRREEGAREGGPGARRSRVHDQRHAARR